MTGSPTTVSSKPLFQELGILTNTQYILSFMMLLVNHLHYYTFKSSIQVTNTREKKLQTQIGNFMSYQRDAYYASIKTFNALPTSIANQVTNKNCFIGNLKTFLLDKPFYSSEEYFNLCTRNED